MRTFAPILVYEDDGNTRADMIEVLPYNGLYCLKSEADTVANDQSLLSMTLLVHYQEWSGTTVTNAGQAFDIVSILRRSLWNKTKNGAVDFLVCVGYDSMTNRARALVDSIWGLKKIYWLQMPTHNHQVDCPNDTPPSQHDTP